MVTGQRETIRLANGPAADKWMATYEQAMSHDLGPTSSRVVVDDSNFIADRAALPPTSPAWTRSRVRTGAVMGAVQSGKTASMIGVLARSLDNGVNVAVILGGTRTALWRQTLERVIGQLDTRPNPYKHRLFLPNQHDLSGGASPPLDALYRPTGANVKQALSRGLPIVAVVMKQVDHLERLSKTLHQTVFPQAQAVGVPVRLLVIDDEADDSSIDDAGRASGTHAVEWARQVPRRILDLWEHRARPGSTADSHVYATYLAYTATPQANFLQDPQNPLAPRDFVAALRTPGADGNMLERSLTYRVPEGLPAWYTGSDIYYGRLTDELCVVDAAQDPDPEDVEVGAEETKNVNVDLVADAVRAYLIAAAVRLLRAGDKLGPESATLETFVDEQEALDRCCPPMSMLIHPSSETESHFAVRDALLRWWDGSDPCTTKAGGVFADLATNEPAWSRWLASYARSSQLVRETYESGSTSASRVVPDWDVVRDTVVSEIIPGTRIEVINSDPAADDRPVFVPARGVDGWNAPQNHSTIFVAGNVMARGLTLEGLLTTLFTRSTKSPLADTQMQMQRWFGYRGTYIDLCRVFLSREQHDLFIQYADTDHALRSQVLAAMGTSRGLLPTFAVLQGASFQATGKVAGLQSRQLSPGRRPFLRLLPSAERVDPNVVTVAGIFEAAVADSPDSVLIDKRGALIRKPLNLTETANLLDTLRYKNIGASVDEQNRWASVERRLFHGTLPARGALYRAPEAVAPTVDVGHASPYSLAAYLRLWSECLDRSVRGLFTDEDTPQRWSLLDLEFKRREQPRFKVGLRFGAGNAVHDGPMAALGARLGLEIRPMRRGVTDNMLDATWGSRGAAEGGYASDDLFDYVLENRARRLAPDGTRLPGDDGLLLFHLVLHDHALTVTPGLSIPAGGPDHIESTTARRGSEA